MVSVQPNSKDIHTSWSANVNFILFDYSFLVRDEIELEHYIVNSLN
jgi:hypothetical protein